MCRLLGFAAPTRVTVQDALGPGQSAVFQDMARLHRDGWGSAWLSRDRSRIGVERSGEPDDPSSERRDPSPSWLDLVRSPATGLGDTDLTRTLTDDPSAARIVHLRMATGGMACAPENTHPFVADGMAFAHNGALAPVSRIEEHVDPDILATVAGITDSERYFAAIRSRIAHLALDDGSAVLDAVAATVRDLRQDFPSASLNALLLTPSQLIAIHASDSAQVPHGDFDASGLSDAELPIDHRQGYYLMRWRRLADRTVVFASSGLDIAGWEPLPPESVAAVDLRTLDLDVRGLDAHGADSEVARRVA